MEKRSVIVSSVGSLLAFLVSCSVVAVASMGHVNLSSTVFLGTCALFVLSLALGFAAWMLGLMKTARIGRWDWFVAVLFLGPAGALLYGISGPAGHPHMVMSSERRNPMAYMR